MLIVKVEKGNLNRALKNFKKKFRNTQVIKEVRERQYFVKPSLKKKLIKDKAIRRLKKQKENNDE